MSSNFLFVKMPFHLTVCTLNNEENISTDLPESDSKSWVSFQNCRVAVKESTGV